MNLRRWSERKENDGHKQSHVPSTHIPSIACVVSNDSEAECDEIPDLSITRTRSFDEDDEIIYGQVRNNSSSLPVICEDDRSAAAAASSSSSDRSSETVDDKPALGSMIPTLELSNDRCRAMLYDDVQKMAARCAEMQKQLEAKDDAIEELDESKQSIIRSFKDAREYHHNMQRKYETMYKKVCARQSKQIFEMNANINERDNQVKERDAVIEQLLDANEKLEVALKAMTKVAKDAIKAKKQVREDLNKLKSKHLNDILRLNRKHDDTIKELRSHISSKVAALDELEATKARLVAQLHAKERELKHEIATRRELYGSSYDVDSAKKLLLQGAARTNAIKTNVGRRKERKPVPTENHVRVQQECNWLQEQIQSTILKIVDAKSNIESMESDVNAASKTGRCEQARNYTRKPLGVWNR